MKTKKIRLLFIFFILYNFFFLSLYSQINNKILVKVGELLITSVDLQNEIMTNLIINKQELTQINIDGVKSYAVQNLVNKSLKKSEINKYQIRQYNKVDLDKYLNDVAKQLNTNTKNLKKRFEEFNISYEVFVESHKTELLWNTLIFQLYKNQTNINIVEVDRQIEKIKKNKSEEELRKIKKDHLNKKKEEKFKLFSRSHFSNLENTISIKFL